MDMKPRVQGRCPEWRPGSLLCSHYTDTWSWSSVQCRPGAESVSTNARWVSEKTKGGARGQAGPGSCWTGWSEVGVWGGGHGVIPGPKGTCIPGRLWSRLLQNRSPLNL